MQAKYSTSGPDKRSEALKRLEQAVEQIQDSETFRQYLDVQARFHKYSVGNAIMIMCQMPHASHVAGFHKWLELHRYVRKGEKGIAILAPCVYHKKSQDDEDETAMYFKLVYVFDVSQTDGEDLPSVACPELQSDDGAEMYTALLAFAKAESLTVECSDTLDPGCMGYYHPGTKRIVLRPAAKLQMVKTLAHELAHYLCQDKASGPESESIAESVAYVVCSHFGLDTGARSFPYVAVWSKDKKVLKSVLATVQKISSQMIDAVAA